MAFSFQDQMLKAYIDKIFDKYDTDKSGTLDQDELTFFFNDLFRQLNIPTTVTKQQSLEAIKSIDQNSDGSVDKHQLFAAFRKMIERPQAQMATSYPPPQQPNYPGYNQPYQNPYQPVYHNPYNVQNPYLNQQPQYQGYNPYQNQPPQYNPYQYPPQYNGYNSYMGNNSQQYMGGSTANRWGRMQ